MSEWYRPSLLSRKVEELGFPADLTTATLNELLGLFRTLDTRYVRVLARASEPIPCATPALQRSASKMTSLAGALHHWPSAWHQMLDRLGTEVVRDGDQFEDPCVVTSGEARRLYVAFERAPRSEAMEVPKVVRRETSRFLANNLVRVGRRRFHAYPGVGQASPQSSRLLQRSRSSRPLHADDVVSERVITELFDVTVDQLAAMRKVGIVPAYKSWTSAGEVMQGLQRLTRHVKSRRPGAACDYASISELPEHGLVDFEALLSDVESGRIHCVTWSHAAPPGLSNLYVDWSEAQRYFRD